MPLDTVKLSALKAIKNPTAGEILAVYWGGDVGTKYYSFSRLHELPNFSGIPVSPVEARFNSFQEFELSADISDETITFDFQDIDQQIADDFYAGVQGVKCELFYWFPQVNWMTSLWWGILQPPRDADYERFKAEASAGFMSQMLMMPRRALYPVTCPYIFGGSLATMDEVNQCRCQYDRHLGGTRGLLIGGVPATSCPKNIAACLARWGDKLSYGGIDSSAGPIVTNTQGFIAASRGNQSNLKRPLRVIIGTKVIRDLDLLVWRRESSGWVSGVWAVCEGPVKALWAMNVNDVWAADEHTNYRLGTVRQPRTNYTFGTSGELISNFSGTAHVFMRFLAPNANNSNVDLTQAKTLIACEGVNDIRIYEDEETYTEEHTNNRVWGLLECYRNRTWGRGYAVSRFDLPSWIYAGGWCDVPVRFSTTDPDTGTVTNYDHKRTQFDVDMQGRIAQQQITDICRSGRLGIPFQHEGKYRIVPLKKEDLANVPVFTDIGENRNIERDQRGKPILSYSQISPAKLPNKIVLTYDHGDLDVSGTSYDIERPLVFEDDDAQKAAGEALGDTTIQVVEKRYAAYGIRHFNEAVKLGWSLLDLGEFDSGGLKNNLEIRFQTWFTHAIELHKYKVIRVVSPLLQRHFAFEYFRIKSLRRRKDLKVDVIAQAYPEDYYETFEVYDPPDIDPPPIDPIDPIDPPIDPIDIGPILMRRTASATFGDISYEDGVLSVEVLTS